jgi:hypothetical protein
MEAMPKNVKPLPSFCRFIYTIMLLWGFHSDDINKPSCLFGKLRFIMNNAPVEYTYEQFQSERRNVIKEGTDQDNNTRKVSQDSIKNTWPSGSFTFMFYGKPKTIHFGSMLVTAVTATHIGPVHIKLRDLVRVTNDTAVVLESCTLKNKLKAELISMEYSDDSRKNSQHVGNFIRGLFGKGGMMLFGCGNA